MHLYQLAHKTEDKDTGATSSFFSIFSFHVSYDRGSSGRSKTPAPCSPLRWLSLPDVSLHLLSPSVSLSVLFLGIHPLLDYSSLFSHGCVPAYAAPFLNERHHTTAAAAIDVRER